MITPYEDSQVPAILKIRSALIAFGRALVAMATGLGKTIVCAFAIKDSIKVGRTLFLCHDNSILEQDMKEFKLVLGDEVRMGVFHGEKKHWDEVDILFASLQTMVDWKDAFFEDEFYRVIVDESHHSQARTFKKVITYFKPKELIGLTGTPDRMDQKDIREIFGEEVVNIPLEEGIAKGWLAEIEYHLITDNLNHQALKKLASEVLEKGKRISLKQLNETVFIEARDEKIAEKILSYGKKKTIVFCESIAHANNFQKFLPGSRVYHSKVKPKATNKQTLEDFRSGVCQCILVVDKFNEGIDIPDAELIVFLRCTDSKNVFLQQLGRGARRTATKRKVIVLDFVANAERVVAIREITQRVRLFAKDLPELEKDPIHIKGDSFTFIFEGEIIDLITRVLQRLQPRYVSDVPLMLAWYSEKNTRPATEVFACTRQLLHWKCPKCGNESHTSGSYRYKNLVHLGCECIKCIKRKNTLAVRIPHLLVQYSHKNPLPFDVVSIWSDKRVIWVCEVCTHEWQQSPKNRNKGTGCPACVNQVVTERNNLTVTHPWLAAEYSPNNPFPASSFIAGTSKKLLWICKVCENEYASTGHNRVNGQGCPKCGWKRCGRRRSRL